MKLSFYVKNVLLFIMFLFFLSVDYVTSGELKTISRPYDFFLLNGKSLSNFSNIQIPINQLYLYSFNSADNQWKQIPFQIDELYLFLSEADTIASYFPEDTSFILLNEPDSLFNNRDELVFMIRDVGDKADTDNWIDDPVAQQYPRYEISLIDEYNNTKGWVYLYRSTAMLLHSNNYSYIEYDSVNDRIISKFYEISYNGQTFPKDILITHLGNGDNQDILDRNKLRLLLSPFGFNAEITDENIVQDTHHFEKPIEIIKGPVRVIRRIHAIANLMGADIYKLPFTTWYYPYFYRFSKQFPFIEMLNFKLFKFSFNLNAHAKGMKFYSGDSTGLNTNFDILVDGVGGDDGVEDSLSRNKPFWTMVTGTPGTMLTINKVKYLGDENYSWRLFYEDTINGENNSIGDHGIIFTGSSLNVGLQTQNRIYLTKGNFSADSAWIIFDNFNNPISSIRTLQEITSVKEIPNTIIPNKFKLYSNYPNPFNSETIINYTIAKPSVVSIKIYNQLGQEIRTLVNSKKVEYSNQTSWDGSDDLGKKVNSGIYICRMQADKFIIAKKIIFVK